jgi:hypothetical protein
MPAGIIPNEGLDPTIQELLGVVAVNPVPWQLMFFQNDITPDADTVFADLVEADFDGYNQLTLTRDQWVTEPADAGCIHATWGTVAQVWYVLGGPPQTLYGYAYYDATSDIIRFIQRFDPDDIAPLEIGGKVTLLPEYTLTSAECA